MGLETGTTLAALNSSWPLGADVKSQGDDHIRLIKAALKATFPGAGATGFSIPITATEAQLNFVTGVTSNIQTQLNAKAPLASPTFTGVPAAPTAVAGTNTTQLATTAFVTTADNLKSNIASPTFTGVPAAPTATAGTNTTQLATTAFVTSANAIQAALDVQLAGAQTITGVKTFQAAAEPVAKNICKAWCNFDGTLTGTNAPRSGFNVTSVTRNAVGDYTINFTNALANTNYCVSGIMRQDAAGLPTSGANGVQIYRSATAQLTTSVRIGTGTSSGVDAAVICIQIFGD